MTTLRVAASDYLGEALLLPVLRRLAADATPLRFDITTTNSVEAARLLADGLVDVAMVSTHRPAGPDAVVLCRQRFYWVAPRRGRARRSRYGRAWRGAAAAAGRGQPGTARPRRDARRAAPAAAVDDRRPQRVADARRTRARGWASAWSPGSRSRAATAAAWSSRRADVPPIDVHLVCRPTLKRTRRRPLPGRARRGGEARGFDG